MPIAYILLVAILAGCAGIDVGISVRDVDEDHLTECTVNRHVASNKECVVELTFEKELTL